jgi:hypothetical protein
MTAGSMAWCGKAGLEPDKNSLFRVKKEYVMVRIKVARLCRSPWLILLRWQSGVT